MAIAVLVGGEVRAEEARPSGVKKPVAAAADPLNLYVQRQTVDGLIVVLKIDGDRITLASVQAARIPRREVRRSKSEETVSVTALSGGKPIATTVVPDPLWVVEEGQGVRKAEQREVQIAVEAPSRVESITVRLSINAATATLDVTSAYAALCRAMPQHSLCKQGKP